MSPRVRLVLAAGTVGLLVAVGLRVTAVPRGLAAGQRALDAADLTGAEAAWRRVLATDPGSAEALYGLGWTLHLAGETDPAREAFQQCLEAHPESALGYKGLGSVAMAEGNAALARRRFEQALALAPEDVAIRHSLALLDLSTGRVDEAVAAFQALAAAEPTRAAFRQALGEALVRAGRPEEGLDAASEAIALSAGDPRMLALAQVTRARAILAATAGRVDPADCTGSATPVYTWLAEADRGLDAAEATAVPLPDLVSVRRSVRQRRGAIDDTCPGVRGGVAGKEIP
jgi:Flp pilus assembly protein TadD